MQGSTFKRCPCPVRRDNRGRRLSCGKSHGSWSYVVDVPGTAGEKRRQVMRGGFHTRRAAEAALAEFIGFAAKGEVASPGRRTLAAYLDEWLIGIGPTLAVAAWTNYRSMINLYVRPRIGQLQLAAVSGSTLSKLYAELLAHGGMRGKPLSATTVRLVHRVLSKSFEDAVEARLVAANPARRAKVPRPGRREMNTWTAEEAARFLTFAADDRLYACWLLALVCGMRRGELAGLRWSVVDFPNETLRGRAAHDRHGLERGHQGAEGHEPTDDRSRSTGGRGTAGAPLANGRRTARVGCCLDRLRVGVRPGGWAGLPPEQDHGHVPEALEESRRAGDQAA